MSLAGAVAAEDHPRQRRRHAQAAGVARLAAATSRSAATRWGSRWSRRCWPRSSSRRSARSRATSTTTTPRASASGSRTTCACASTTTCSACRSRYYDTHQTGDAPVDDHRATSTTVQDFASSATLGILVDLLTIVGMLGHHVLARLGLRADRRRRHAVPAAVRDALQEGGEEGDPRGPQAAERHRRGGAAGARVGARRSRPSAGRTSKQAQLDEASRATVDAALKARRVKSLLSPVVTIVVALCTGDRALARHGADPRRRDDGRRADRLPRLPQQVLQAGAGPGEDDQHDRADGGRRSSASRRSSTPTTSSPSSPMRAKPRRRCKGEITFDHVAFGYDPEAPVLKDVELHDHARPAGRRSSARPAAASRPS